MDRFEFFSKLPLTEPGGAVFTSAYLTQIQIKATDLVLELGCGGGDLSAWVARSRGCRIISVDDDPRFVHSARDRAEDSGAGNLVKPIVADYRQLPFPDHSFKVVIAEGTAMKLGLKQALTLWRRLVPPQGHLAITYPGVVNKAAPDEVRAPLEARMVEPLGTLPEYHKAIRAAGYEVVHQVPLQPELWDAFYRDAIRHAWALLDHQACPEDDPVVQGVIEEARWYRRVGRGRVFLQALVLRRLR